MYMVTFAVIKGEGKEMLELENVIGDQGNIICLTYCRNNEVFAHGHTKITVLSRGYLEIVINFIQVT